MNTLQSSQQITVFFNFLYKIFYQSYGRKNSHVHSSLRRFLSSKLNTKLYIFNVKKLLYEVTFCDVQCDPVMTSSRL